MILKFKSEISPSFGYFILVTGIMLTFFVCGLLFFTNYTYTVNELITVSAIVIILYWGLFAWLWFSTFYIIKGNLLIAKFGLFNWKVSINEISFIRLNQRTIGGTWKLTRSWKCIEIHYKKSRSIFISPVNERLFLDQLLEINNTIEIKPK